MPTPFEAEIGALLRDLKDPVAVAEDLVRRWAMGVLSTEEQRDCAQFLIAAGLYSTLFQAIRTLSNEKSQIPWAQFADAVGLSRLKPSNVELDAIFEGAKAQNSLSDLVLSFQLDIWSRRFQENRAQIVKIREADLEARKLKLKDELEFMRANRIVKEEERLIREAEALFPADVGVQKDRESFEMRSAREVIARAMIAFETPEAEDLARRAERLTPEQEGIKQLINQRAHEIADQHPDLAYELALNLHLMDFHIEAIDLLAKAPTTAAADWLKLDLLLAARLFVDALTESQRLEAIYGSDPEAIFAATYARARALKGLGQDGQAVDLMRGLVRTRPGYKSAQSFLMDWSGGDE